MALCTINVWLPIQFCKGKEGRMCDNKHKAEEDFEIGINVRDLSVNIGPASILKNVDVTAPKGSCLAVLGPSGCGKTTLLRTLAGLQKIDSGEINLCGETVATDKFQTSPEQRDVGMVFQDWALFPHLTVLENTVFGLSRADRKKPRSEIHELLEMVGIPELADRFPSSLSGGQQQRVALARALAPRPSVLLLDEPFSSLDTSLRIEVRAEVSELLRSLSVTSVFVTHDQDEAFALGDQVAVMNEGRVVQQDAPSEVYKHPADQWVAGFVGEANTIRGMASGETADTTLGSINLCHQAHGPVDVLIRPEEVTLVDGAQAVIKRVDFFGHDTLYVVSSEDAGELRCRTGGVPTFKVGDRVNLQHSGAVTVSFPSS